MRLAFFGTPTPAVAFLRALVEDGHRIVRVVTRPDRPTGRSRVPQAPPVKIEAARLGLPIDQPRSVRGTDFARRLRGDGLDAAVVVAYGRILPGGLLDAPRSGAINVHFSLLPRYRGAAPVQWALARGESVTGVSTMRLDEGLDSGPVFERREVAIHPREHAPALQRRLVEAGVPLLRSTLAGLARGDLEPRAQDEESASLAPMLGREDGWVDPADPAPAIEGRVRGFDPWPGVWLARARSRVRLVEAYAVVTAPVAAPPGTVLGLDGEILPVACGSGSVLGVERLQPAGRRVMSARDAVNGRQIAPGDVLERILG